MDCPRYAKAPTPCLIGVGISLCMFPCIHFFYFFLHVPIAELQALGSCHFKYPFVKLLLGWFAIACPSVACLKLETNPLKWGRWCFDSILETHPERLQMHTHQTKTQPQMFAYRPMLKLKCKCTVLHWLSLDVTSLAHSSFNHLFWDLISSRQADQPYTPTSVFHCCPLSSTLRIASKIYPWGSNIRHAKVKTSYCHLEWLNVYQAHRYTLAYGIGTWHPLTETLTEYSNPH